MSSDAHEGCVKSATKSLRCVGPVNKGCLTKRACKDSRLILELYPPWSQLRSAAPQDYTFKNIHVNAFQLSSEKFTDKNARNSQISLLLGAGASYIINAYSVILSVLEFYFLTSRRCRLRLLEWIRRKTNVSLFSLRTVASLSIWARYCSPDPRVFPFCPTAHENRRGAKTESGHQLHLNKEEAPAHPHGMTAPLPTFIFSSCPPYESAPLNPADALNQPEEWQKELLTGVFFHQDADSKGAQPLLPSVLVRAGPHKRFCPLTITARRRWSLLSLICIGISSISIPGTTEEQTCMDRGVKGALRPRHISSNQ